MAEIKVLKFSSSAEFLKEEHDDAADSIKMLSLKTATYELTDTKLGHLVDGADNANEHIHDGRYYQESEFLNVSAGAEDAGKPVVLDAAGHIDATMINDGDVAHDSTGSAAASTVHTAFPLLAGGRSFTAIQRYDATKTYTNDYEIVDKKYVDDLVASAVTLGEWQNSVLNIQTDNTLDPGESPTTGDRYVLTDVANLHANFGSISGVADDDIVNFNGSAFVVAYTPTVGARVGNDAQTDRLYFFSGSAWSAVYFESTTASLGCKKSGFDIQADLLASGGLKLSTNSLCVEPNDFAGEGLVDDGSDNLAIDWSSAYNDSKAIKASDLYSTASGKGASIIGIYDTAGLYDAANVEAALAEVMNVAKEGSGITYTADGSGVTKGDLVYISANNVVSVLSDLTVDSNCVGLALSTAGAAADVKVARLDTLMLGVLTTATFGTVYYWDGSAISSTIPSATNSNIWMVGTAKNATDLSVEVKHLRKLA